MRCRSWSVISLGRVSTAGLLLWVCSSLCGARVTYAQQQGDPDPGASGMLSAEELDELVAPIALYPDALLAQVLPASTQPLDIVQAARYLEDQGGKVDQPPGNDWAPSVQALLQFPEVLRKMDKELSWTQKLGDAVIGQQEDVMNAIQHVRNQAYAAGNLVSSDKQIVVVEQQVIKVVPADPQIIYVPQYNPQVVVVKQEPNVAPLIAFGAGLLVGAIIANNDCDWHHHHIYGGHYYGHVDVNVNRNVNRNVNANRGYGQRQAWKPSNQARNRYDARSRGRANPGAPGARAARPGARPAARPGSRPGDRRAGRGNKGTFDGYKRGGTAKKHSRRGNNSRRGSQSRGSARRGGTSRQGGAFDRGRSGGNTRKQSNRGSRSRGGGGRSRGGGRGRR